MNKLDDSGFPWGIVDDYYSAMDSLISDFLMM